MLKSEARRLADRLDRRWAPFIHGSLGTRGLGICFTIIFFIASSAASAAYLTVSEIFPLEIRAFAIAIFYAIGTLIGGVGAPSLFGVLIATGSKSLVSVGYLIGAVLMLGDGVCEHFIGVVAAGKSLESVAIPYHLDLMLRDAEPFPSACKAKRKAYIRILLPTAPAVGLA